MYIRDHHNCNTVESMDRADAIRRDYPNYLVVKVMAKDYAFVMMDGEEYEIAFYTKDGEIRTGDCFNRRYEY